MHENEKDVRRKMIAIGSSRQRPKRSWKCGHVPPQVRRFDSLWFRHARRRYECGMASSNVTRHEFLRQHGRTFCDWNGSSRRPNMGALADTNMGLASRLMEISPDPPNALPPQKHTEVEVRSGRQISIMFQLASARISQVFGFHVFNVDNYIISAIVV